MTRAPSELVLFGGIALVLGACGFLLPEFYVTLLNYIGLYGLVALGLLLLTGISGITSFGQAAFVGLGAYTTAVLTTGYGLSPWVGLVAGLALTGAAALVLGGVTLRLSGHYLPLGTICWSVSLYYVFGNLTELGGQTGLSGIPAISLFGYDLDTGRRMYFLIWVVVLGCLLFASNLLNAAPGRAMRAMKNRTETAESFGIDPGRVRLKLFVFSALLACLSGWLYAHLIRYLNPTPFGLTMSIEYLFMAVIGGAGHVLGAILGSAVVTILREVLQDVLPQVLGRSGNFEIIAFGLLVIVLLQVNRESGLGAVLRFLTRSRSDAKPVAPDQAAERKQRSGPVLQVRGIRKTFGGLVAIDDLSFEVGSNEIVAVIGPNGAGKSTVFNVITGLLSADRGSVLVEGSRVDRLPPYKIVTHGIARTFQHVRLIPDLSVLENTMLGAHLRAQSDFFSSGLGLTDTHEERLRSEAAYQLTRVGLGALMQEPAGNLPLGQQRLVEIARALCARPSIMLLDEPAAGLRFGEKQDLANLLAELRDGGLSIVIVEHDMPFVMKLADRIVVMNFGQKLTEGPPREVRTNPQVLEAYLGGSLE